MAKTSKTVVSTTVEREGFEFEGKIYAFKGEIKRVIVPGKGKIEVSEILNDAEICAEMVRNGSDLIEEIASVEVA